MQQCSNNPPLIEQSYSNFIEPIIIMHTLLIPLSLLLLLSFGDGKLFVCLSVSFCHLNNNSNCCNRKTYCSSSSLKMRHRRGRSAHPGVRGTGSPPGSRSPSSGSYRESREWPPSTGHPRGYGGATRGRTERRMAKTLGKNIGPAFPLAMEGALSYPRGNHTPGI